MSSPAGAFGARSAPLHRNGTPGASWRALPEECGTWETADKRYRLWHATGLWQRILEALAEGGGQVSL